MLRARWPLLAMVIFANACATLAGDGKGDVDLPSVAAGPFRALKRGQICDGDVCTGVNELPSGTADGVPKYANSPPAKSPSVLVRGGGGKDLRVVLYAARGPEGAPDKIVRMEAKDARDFSEDMVDVIDRPAFATSIDDPWAMEVDGLVVVYFTARTATGTSIGRAKSTDGLAGRAFTVDAAPITLGGAKGIWEDDPRSPSVVRLENGTYRLFYGTGHSIGEASSPDGVSFTRLEGPVLGPATYVDPATLPEGVRPPFDDESVDDPCVARDPTPTGRILYRLLYTGRDKRGGSSVGYAGRFGDKGAFDRRDGFVFGGKLSGSLTNSHVNAPAVARFPDFALIYANRDVDRGQKLGIGISPQKLRLPIDE